MVVEIGVFGEITDALVHGGVIQFLTQYSCRARGGKNQAEKDFERGRLPRPIRAQQAEDFARLHLEVQGVQSPLRGGP